jgi:hypothetical protein
MRLLLIDGETRYGCVCGVCDRHYSTPGNLNHHITRDHDCKRFACPWLGCRAAYTSAIKLARHAESAHRGQLFVCGRHGCRKLYLSPELLVVVQKWMKSNSYVYDLLCN